MLIITRRLGESFMIINEQTGEELEVFQLSSKGNQVRVGIECPKHYTILRKELYDQKKANQGE